MSASLYLLPTINAASEQPAVTDIWDSCGAPCTGRSFFVPTVDSKHMLSAERWMYFRHCTQAGLYLEDYTRSRMGCIGI